MHCFFDVKLKSFVFFELNEKHKKITNVKNVINSKVEYKTTSIAVGNVLQFDGFINGFNCNMNRVFTMIWQKGLYS